jgi:hypothetical protein
VASIFPTVRRVLVPSGRPSAQPIRGSVNVKVLRTKSQFDYACVNSPMKYLPSITLDALESSAALQLELGPIRKT